MKIGMRKPSLKKSISARTTGRAKRAIKKAVIPGYGKKGMGWITNPKKAAYNKVYHKTTFGVNDVIRAASSNSSHKSAKQQKIYNNPSSYKNNSYKQADVITQEDIKQFEKIHDIDTSARITPAIFVVAAIICIFSTMTILIFIGLVLDIIALILLCRKPYWIAHRYRQAVQMFLKEDYEKCRKYLDKIPAKEKETQTYKEFSALLDEEISGSNYESDQGSNSVSESESKSDSDFVSNSEGRAWTSNEARKSSETGTSNKSRKNSETETSRQNYSQSFSDECSSEEEKHNDESSIEDEIDSEKELEVYNEVKNILAENKRNLAAFYMKHTGVYCDLCESSSVFLRVKLGGRKQYILTNLSDSEIEKLHLTFELPSKSEKYKSRINLDSHDVIRKLTTYIIVEFDNCSSCN